MVGRVQGANEEEDEVHDQVEKGSGIKVQRSWPERHSAVNGEHEECHRLPRQRIYARVLLKEQERSGQHKTPGGQRQAPWIGEECPFQERTLLPYPWRL